MKDNEIPAPIKNKAYWSQEIGDKICSLIAEGNSLRDIAALPGMPAPKTIVQWSEKFEDFGKLYMQARSLRADYRFERIDFHKKELRDGIIEPEVARLLIDAEKWQAGKENPKRYGDKQQIDVNTTVDINALIITAANRRLDKLAANSLSIIENNEFTPVAESIEDYL